MTDTATLTLTDFLLARVAEDEAWVTKTGHAVMDIALAPGACVFCWAKNTNHLAGCPTRVLAECKAKRRIVHRYEYTRSRRDARSQGYRGAMAALAAVYADHPDYRDEWRP